MQPFSFQSCTFNLVWRLSGSEKYAAIETYRDSIILDGILQQKQIWTK